MAIIEKEDYIFDVDIEKTKEHCSAGPLCDCYECRNYYRQAAYAFPKLKNFLLDFGIDIARPAEIHSTYHKGAVDYHTVTYTVVGECIKFGKYEFDMEDGGLFINPVISTTPVFPNEQQCFEIFIYNIRLPWALEEPPKEEEEKVKISIWTKIKRLFNKE